MFLMNCRSFSSKPTVHSGDMLSMFIEDLDLSVIQIANSMKIGVDALEIFIKNGYLVDLKITPELLECATGVSASFWENIETQYKKDTLYANSN